jgi:uncharacterized protein (TIGR03083 family)
MEPVDLLLTVPAQTDAAARAAEELEPGSPVPSCPGWDVETLVGHLGGVHRWAAHLIATGSLAPERPSARPPGGAETIGWLREGAAELVALGRDKGPDAPAWNFAGHGATSAFWFRRMAHETAAHRWDLEAAAGTARPVPADLASDGIDELLTLMLPRRRIEGLTGTLHIHCTDVAGEWTIDLATFETKPGHAKGDAALRGPASDLLLRLLNRAGGGESLGDERVLTQWHDSVHF